MPSGENFKNSAAYWFLGLCNNFAYVVMLSAAKDIIENGEKPQTEIFNVDTEGCPKNASEFRCSSLSTGAVLLADIIPSFVIKLFAPFLLSSIAYNVRMVAVILLQALSFILVAASTTVIGGLSGVIFASLGSGLGDVTLLSLASHFPGFIIVAWASGTGFAGVSGALTYAALTDANMCNLSPRTALYVMLTVTLLFSYSFFKLLSTPPSVHNAVLWMPWTFMIPRTLSTQPPNFDDEEQDPLLDADSHDDAHQPLLVSEQPSQSYTEPESTSAISASASDPIPEQPAEPVDTLPQILKPLIKYMVPLCVVYYGEYLINQGLFEFVIFTCDEGIGLSQSAQYRWYQVLYQIGVFLSRSSVSLFVIDTKWLPLFAALQYNVITSKMPKQSFLLSPQETFEKYERRSPVPPSVPAATNVSPVFDPQAEYRPASQTSQRHSPFIAEFTEIPAEPKKLPYGWIIGIAIGVPVFVMIVLFLAVWLQELGWV